MRINEQFPSIQTTVTDMMAHNPLGSRKPSEAHTSSEPSSITCQEGQGMASSPKISPLYRPPYASAKKPSLERQSPTPKIYENSKPNRPAQQGMPAEFTFPARTRQVVSSSAIDFELLLISKIVARFETNFKSLPCLDRVPQP